MKKTEKTPENLAKEWLDLKNQRLLIEKRMEDIKPALEAYLAEQTDYESEMCGYLFKLVNSEREHFKLAEAKKKIDKRILKPFLTIISYNQIRATFRGQQDKEAA